MHVAIDLLDPPAHRIHGDRPLAPDDELVVSIRGMGVLTPLLVTAEGNRYRIVDGLRRHEAALLLGLPELPIHIEANLPGAHALVATTATNLVRAPVPPTQQWRALAALQAAEGMPLDQAAAYLGMDPRHARRLARLGQLHPELLAVLERYEANPEGHGVPRLGDRQLGDIASAPPEVQLAAYEAHRDADGDPAWDRIADRCRVRRISAQHAIFDRATAGVIFDEDLFAEPGSADQFTTADIDGFIAAQRLALAELVDTLRPKRRWHVTEQDGSSAATQVGLRPVATHDTRPRLSGDEHCFAYVETGGWQIGRVRWTVAIPKAAATPAPADDDDLDRDDDEEADAGLDDDDDDAEPAADVPAQPERDIRPLTKTGQTLVAKAKTQALGDALRATVKDCDWRGLVAYLILAFHARNVTVKARPHLHDDKPAAFRAMVDPAGQLITPDDATLASLAAGTLATVLSVDDPAIYHGHFYDVGSGEVAEWIGAAIRAADHLPRMDTEAMLREATGATLKSAAQSAGLKPAAKVADLRRQLEGHAKAWRPPGAEFGAPGPKPLPASRRRNAAEMEDAA